MLHCAMHPIKFPTFLARKLCFKRRLPYSISIRDRYKCDIFKDSTECSNSDMIIRNTEKSGNSSSLLPNIPSETLLICHHVQLDATSEKAANELSIDDKDTKHPVNSSQLPLLAAQYTPVTIPSSSSTEIELSLPWFHSSDNFKQNLLIAKSLSKARLSSLVVSTAVVGCALAASTNLASAAFLAHPFQKMIFLGLGTGLTSAAANTFNQILEIPYDCQMTRTRNRPLVRGLTTPNRAMLFSLGCTATGLGVLYSFVDPFVAALAGGNIVLYSAIYTPLKQLDQANTWIGALVGAVPPLMGWITATGEIQSGSLILACLLYVWQLPHFMALSWNLRGEYAKAGYMMTAALEPAVCKHVALRYAIASSLVCLAGAGCSAISLGPWAGCALGLTCLPPNVGLIYYAWRFARTATDGSGSAAAAARQLFKATLLHLPIVMTAALIGTYFCATAT